MHIMSIYHIFLHESYFSYPLMYPIFRIAIVRRFWRLANYVYCVHRVPYVRSCIVFIIRMAVFSNFRVFPAFTAFSKLVSGVSGV